MLGTCLSHQHFKLNVYKANLDRKSTRLNSSHLVISYAVFCLKKKIVLQCFSRLLDPALARCSATNCSRIVHARDSDDIAKPLDESRGLPLPETSLALSPSSAT